jgi:hypothetical protein
LPLGGSFQLICLTCLLGGGFVPGFMPVSRRRKRKEPRDVKKEPRDLKKDLVRATTVSSVALLPILGAFGFALPQSRLPRMPLLLM